MKLARNLVFIALATLFVVGRTPLAGAVNCPDFCDPGTCPAPGVCQMDGTIDCEEFCQDTCGTTDWHTAIMGGCSQNDDEDMCVCGDAR